jgi:O-6-methylguanine DNA methyltransferase
MIEPIVIVSTAIGPMEIQWNERAVTSVKLLASGKAKKSARAPEFVRELATALAAHLAGRTQDFSKVPLDYSSVPAFHAKVYAASRKVKSGVLVSYGELAVRAGSPGAARAVGQAMARNPFFVVVPCHRVAASLKKLGGFSAPSGALTKRRMLEIEGAFLESPPYDVARAIRELRAADPALAKVIATAGDVRPRVQPLHSLFESLGRSIIYQQLSGLAAGAIHRKYAALFPDHRPTAEHLSNLSDAQVRAAGLSASKLAALRDLAKRAPELPTLNAMEKMSDDEIIESLTKVRGIGPWTVHMLLIFRLGRPDVLPVADYGVRKGFAKTYGKRMTLEKHAEKWRPWRSVGSWYMWRATEQA